jgi:hypothetical protein
VGGRRVTGVSRLRFNCPEKSRWDSFCILTILFVRDWVTRLIVTLLTCSSTVQKEGDGTFAF